MERFVKLTYIVIVTLFLISMSILGWYVMDTKKENEIEVANLKKQIEELTLPKSEKKIDKPDDLRIIKEYEYRTPSEGIMKIIAFDEDSKVVWEYKTDSTSMV